MGKINVSLTIPDANSFEKTVQAASEVGLRVKDKLDLLGVATGSIERNSVAKLRRVPGVDNVEEQREIGIPRPVGRRP